MELGNLGLGVGLNRDKRHKTSEKGCEVADNFSVVSCETINKC